MDLIKEYIDWCNEKGLKPCRATNLNMFLSLIEA